MKLHYSQTDLTVEKAVERFYYLMKLHYSQTALAASSSSSTFYYLMKLHYSQTIIAMTIGIKAVLLPYEITLFSNLK